MTELIWHLFLPNEILKIIYVADVNCFGSSCMSHFDIFSILSRVPVVMVFSY